MFCANCGTKQNEGEKFCPNCGTKFEEPLKVEVSKVEEISKSKATKPKNIAPEKKDVTVKDRSQTTKEDKIVSTIKYKKENEVKSKIDVQVTKSGEETVATNKLAEEKASEDFVTKQATGIKDSKYGEGKNIKLQDDCSLDFEDNVLWNKLKINHKLSGSLLLQELDLSKQSGVISDKYKFESKIVFDSKTIHQKMQSEEYDEVDDGGSVLRFKFFIDSNFNYESTYVYEGREQKYSNLKYDIRRFNEEIGEGYFDKYYYLKFVEDSSFKGSCLVEGLFTKEHKGFWGFMKTVPNADKLEIKFKEIYSICKKIKLL